MLFLKHDGQIDSGMKESETDIHVNISHVSPFSGGRFG